MMRGVLQLQLEARWAEDRVEINLPESVVRN